MVKPVRTSPLRQCPVCKRVLREGQPVVQIHAVLDDELRGIRFVPVYRYAHLVCPPPTPRKEQAEEPKPVKRGVKRKRCAAVHAATNERCTHFEGHTGDHFASQPWPEGGEWNFSDEEAKA